MMHILEDEINRAHAGKEAPDFTLRNEKGEEWRLSDRRGQVVALLFYPGDETLVCTKQLCSVRDHWAEYVDTGAEVVGISPSSMESHRRFAHHYNLPLPLLADTDSNVTKTYSHHWWMPSWITRTIVVIDAKGIIRSRRVMLAAFRPKDKELIVAIRCAQFDALATEWCTRAGNQKLWHPRT
jgi:peroxiredoxin Q/BCP